MVDEDGQNAVSMWSIASESCNLLDDDCDGEVDEDFELTEVTGCGSCENDCTVGAANAEWLCTRSVRDRCLRTRIPGSRPEPSNGCECNGAAIDEPDPDFIDAIVTV